MSLTHDQLGRLTSKGYPDGTTVSNVFERLDRVAWKDRLGHWSYACYDCFGQLETETDRNGGTTVYSYCDCGGLASVTDPQGNTTSYGRDNLGRVTNIVGGAGSEVIARDILGRPFHVSSDWGLDAGLGHNYQGLRTGVTNAAGTVWSVVYDEADRPMWVSDGRGVSVTNQFDDAGRLSFVTMGLGRSSITSIWRKASGNTMTGWGT